MKPKISDGMTPLHIAAGSNDVHLVDFILSQVEDPSSAANVRNEEGWTPCHLAAFLNNFDSLNLLVEAGGDLTKKNDNGMSSFDELVRNDHKDLFECVYDIAETVKRDLKQPGSFGLIHLAAGQEGHKCLKFLLDQGESTN